MDPIIYIDRTTGKEEIEHVYAAAALKFIYGDEATSRYLGMPLLHMFVKNPIFSAVYGFWQKQRWTKRKIAPFIEMFHVDPSEFFEQVDQFDSFNDFFIRKLKPEARPLAAADAIIPADGRYLFHPNISEAEGFFVKGEKFDLTSLLEDAQLASRYTQGSIVMGRLCPTDYHRYHFPCDCIPGETRLINGWLYSVNPVAIKKDIHIFTKNKRAICELHSEQFGRVLFIEIGATNVGSINQTYTPNASHSKGDEKGFFSFGASSLILLFEPGRIVFDQDLLAATAAGHEIKCLMGQSMGKGL
ncbi:MAG: phosphatidylserine decarboxylase [Parachlamydiaceae bacterium]|nr:phosphatidylserine decarboxylase [Parachlamydiaceae bacterium]